MATFATVNTSFGEHTESDRAPLASHLPPSTPTMSRSRDANGDESSPNTPTRHTFSGIAGQRALPDPPLQSTENKGPAPVEAAVKRETRTRPRSPESVKTTRAEGESQDVDMGHADDDGNVEDDDDDASGNESTTSDTQRPSKKKKGQRFFCTDFPPCQLSFTRSEHLARHIRKHTGERPFQCHCSRRFSRLDNLRQHAQTVHVNEEIPGDSLAAQSTRFQRQIRTDRVRPAGSRSRASTIGSQGGHSRGHSRNLSASSIGSTASSMSLTEDTRRRPQPLAMANESPARARLSVDTYGNVNASPASQYAYYHPSSSGYSTPTSSVFSNGNASPQFQPAIISPPASISRSSFYNGNRTHGRRLSVPSTQNPFQASSYPPPYFTPMAQASTPAFSPTSQVFASPTSSVFSHGRRDSESEIDLRRRTWHPTTNSLYAQRPATSGLTYHQTPDEPRPAFSQQPAASQMTRLPGIESFDHAPPPAPRQQPPSPMMVDAAPRPRSSGRSMEAPPPGLTRLDTAAANAEAHAPSSSLSSQPRPLAPAAFLNQPPIPGSAQYVPTHHVSMPEPPVTPRTNKRNAWYGGPVGPAPTSHPPPPQPPAPPGARTSPEDSGSSDGVTTPSIHPASELNPVIVHHPGMQEPYPSAAANVSEEGKPYYDAAAVVAAAAAAANTQPRKAGPMRADSGVEGVPQTQQQQQPLTPTPHMYALHAGHDPRLAHASYHHHHHHHHHPPGNDMAKLEALVAVATSQNRAVEHHS